MRSQKFTLVALLSIAVMITVAASKAQTFT